MQKITIYSIGKIKEPFVSAQLQYVKRLSRYCALEIVELREMSKREATDRFERYVSGHTYLLDVDGVSKDSERFSELLDNPELIFLIGGADGIGHLKVKKLSLSKMTFPHDMAKVLLLEQLYRGFTIRKGLPYHK